MKIKKLIWTTEKYHANRYVTYLEKFGYPFHTVLSKMNYLWIFSLNLNNFNFHKTETTFETILGAKFVQFQQLDGLC